MSTTTNKETKFPGPSWGNRQTQHQPSKSTTTTAASTTVINPNQKYNTNNNNNNNNNNKNNNNEANNKSHNNKNNNNRSQQHQPQQRQKPLPNIKISPSTTTTTPTTTKQKTTTKTALNMFRTKYFPCSFRLSRRKQVIGLIFAALLYMLYITSMGPDDSDGQERIPVIHYSHVPGMRDANSSQQQLQKQQQQEQMGQEQRRPIKQTNEAKAERKEEIKEKLTEQKMKIENFLKNQKQNENENQEKTAAAAALDFAPAAAAASASASASALINQTAAAFDKSTDAVAGDSRTNKSKTTIITTTNTTTNFQNFNLNLNQNNNNNNLKNTSFNPSPPSQNSNFLLHQQKQQPNASAVGPTSPPPPPPPPPGYLVWSERCKMPNVDPYLPEIMKYFKREKYKPCSVQTPLTTVAYSELSQSYVLRIVDDVIPSYSKTPKALNCCYQIIERNATGADADKDVSLSDCISFKKSTKLSPHIDNILVKCRVKKKQVYINGHAMMPVRLEIRQRLDAWRRNDTQAKRHRPPSVLMIGIDSISRTNLIRAMPRTAQYLYDNEWFEMSGYNKIDDNTFPNLVAVLAGINKTYAYKKCPPTTLNGLDNCNFIWGTFRDHGYVTAYAEDEASINTFNYLKMGFEKPPVDYYLRPFLLSAEKHLRVTKVSGLNFCLGYQHSADFVYEYAIELARRYKNEPYFGLFWTNSFSHNAISDCTAMDEKMVEYLERFSKLGAFDNSIVIFFSDHGMRFGPTRNSHSGHLEERLPFLFIWLPQSLKQTHPEFVNALSVNKNRLTNPYDMHMTLKHILSMSERVEDQSLLQPAESCARCQSMLEPVPHNRSCDDVAIEAHWCTCIPYQSVYKNSKLVQNLAKSAVNYINQYVSEFKNGTYAAICAPLHLSNVESAYRAQPGALSQFDSINITNMTNESNNQNQNQNNNDLEIYRLIFQTKPNKAIFEATLRVTSSAKLMNNPQIEVTGEISRLNTYKSDSECVPDGGAKKYCSCRSKKKII